MPAAEINFCRRCGMDYRLSRCDDKKVGTSETGLLTQNIELITLRRPQDPESPRRWATLTGPSARTEAESLLKFRTSWAGQRFPFSPWPRLGVCRATS